MRRLLLAAAALFPIAAHAQSPSIGAPSQYVGNNITVTTGSVAGVPVVVTGVGTMFFGFSIINSGTAGCLWSNELPANTTLTATNSKPLAAGVSFTTPMWWPLGGALQIAPSTTTPCTVQGTWK